jgi:hypothetical protein
MLDDRAGFPSLRFRHSDELRPASVNTSSVAASSTALEPQQQRRRLGRQPPLILVPQHSSRESFPVLDVVRPRKSGSHRTRHWSKGDSNRWSPVERDGVFETTMIDLCSPHVGARALHGERAPTVTHSAGSPCDRDTLHLDQHFRARQAGDGYQGARWEIVGEDLRAETGSDKQAADTGHSPGRDGPELWAKAGIKFEGIVFGRLRPVCLHETLHFLGPRRDLAD